VTSAWNRSLFKYVKEKYRILPPKKSFVFSESGFFFIKFVRYVYWQSSRRGLSQIWLQIMEESRNFWDLAILTASWKLWSKSGDFNCSFMGTSGLSLNLILKDISIHNFFS
jgi:hypothetical protein